MKTPLEVRALLAEELRQQELVAIALSAVSAEKGRRRTLYNAFKWWGRRYAALARALLASLVLEPGEQSTLLALLEGDNNALEIVLRRAKGKLIVDPFVGGATILVEAALLGFRAYGVDVNPAAVAVAQTTLDIVNGKTCSQVECLEAALIVTAKKLAPLWGTPDSVVIHLLLAPENGGTVEAPAWLTTLRREPRRILIIDPDTPGGLRVVEGSEAEKYRPTHPTVKIPARSLPEEAPGLRAYAAELVSRGVRRFIPLYTEEGSKLAKKLRETRPGQQPGCTPIPALRETKRLRDKGLRCWEQLYTPRQLVSLEAFVQEAKARGCGRLARLVAGNATRTVSLLAMYYQLYSKVNPGLVIKSYWLPRYPVELNPLAYTYTKKGTLRSAGRGTLATYISALRKACSSIPRPRPKAIVVRGDARNPQNIPDEAYAIVTDPPYPGMQSYHDMSLIYLYWLGEPLENSSNSHPLSGADYIKLIHDFSAAAAQKLKPTRALILLIGGDTETLAESLIEVARAGFGLRRLYWLPGEAPGRLGRSKERGIFIAVYKRAVPNREDALQPLDWIDHIAARLEDEKNTLGIDIEKEKERAKTIAETIARRLLGHKALERSQAVNTT